MIGKKCCCCSCVGCATVVLSGIAPDVPAGEPYDTFWTAAYNRSFTLWRGLPSTRTPFDGLTNCTAEEESYPGTQCVLIGNACCAPAETDPVDPPEPDPDPDPDPDPLPDPPPPPGPP